MKGEAFLQTEQQLLQSFSSGDETAIETLVVRYEDRLYNLCFKLASKRHEAEELYQQTWLKVLQKSHTFAPKSFQNWLYTICLNTYRDNFRRNTREDKLMVDDKDDLLKESASPGPSAEAEAMYSIAQAALMVQVNKLPDKLRIPILLYYFEELGYREIAEILRLPTGTVKSRLSTAKNRLRTEMENEADV